MMEAGPLKQTPQMPEPDQDHAAQPSRLAPPAAHPPLWAQRLLLAVEVAIAFWTGILVLVLPWTRLWTENPLLAAWPNVKYFCDLAFVRGMISGIGLLDLWMGASDAVHYRDLR
jgi:hypothetical protein